METDVDYRYLMLVAQEYEDSGYLTSYYKGFSEPVEYQIIKKKTLFMCFKQGASDVAKLGLMMLGAFGDNADYIYPAFQNN
jgi:hypothetical protein